MECDVIENEIPTGSRSTTDAAERSTDVTTSEVTSTGVETTQSSSNYDELDTTSQIYHEAVPRTGRSSLSDQSAAAKPETTTAQSLDEITGSCCTKPEEEKLQDHTLIIPPGRTNIVSSQEGGTEGRICTGSAPLEGFYAAAEDDSPCTDEITGMDFATNQQPETHTQLDPPTADIFRSPEPEIAMNSEAAAAAGRAQEAEMSVGVDEQISALWLPEADKEQRGTRDEVDSRSETGPETATAHASEQLPDFGEVFRTVETSEDRPLCVGEQAVDKNVTTSELQADGVEPAPSSGTLEPYSEEIGTSALTGQNATPTHAGEDQFTAGTSNSSSSDQHELSKSALSAQEPRSGVPPERSGTETKTEIDNAPKNKSEPTFTFPAPPHPVTAWPDDKDDTDEVFAKESSSTRGDDDSSALSEILPSVVMTSLTAAEAGAAANVRQQPAPSHEFADAAPAACLSQAPSTPCSREEEFISEQPAAAAGLAQVPPTPEAAAAATGPATPAEDGEGPAAAAAAKSGDEIRADALLAADELRTSSSSSTFEPACPAAGSSILSASEAVLQHFDEATQQQKQRQDQQQTAQNGAAADRQRLSLLIPAERDSDQHAADKQVAVYTHAHKF